MCRATAKTINECCCRPGERAAKEERPVGTIKTGCAAAGGPGCAGGRSRPARGRAERGPAAAPWPRPACLGQHAAS
eukprot:310714-Lingulodinium_polyedra.AAC.1